MTHPYLKWILWQRRIMDASLLFKVPVPEALAYGCPHCLHRGKQEEVWLAHIERRWYNHHAPGENGRPHEHITCRRCHMAFGYEANEKLVEG